MNISNLVPSINHYLYFQPPEVSAVKHRSISWSSDKADRLHKDTEAKWEFDLQYKVSQCF